MKNIILISASLLTLSIFTISCKSSTEKSTTTSTANEIETTATTATYKIDIEASSINWSGASMVGKAHHGTVSIKEGTLGVDGSKVVSGKFIVDMNNIVNLDLADKKMNDKLLTHLKSADFFDTEKFPIAVLEIAAVTPLSPATATANNTVKANLNIKGINKEISFPAMIKVSDIGVLANANFEINRKDWSVMYGVEGSVAGATKDKIIKNEIAFSVNLIAK